MIGAVLVPVALLANGLAAGVLVGTVLGGVPLLLALPPERYVDAHAFFATRYDPFMPACLLGTVFTDLALAASLDGSAPRALAAASALLAAVTVTVSVSKNVPINKWITTVDPQALPDNWDRLDPRWRWQRWNQVRTTTTLLALLSNLALVGTLL